MATHEILGIDPFREGASIAFGVPYNQVTNSQRTIFKERFSLFACGLGMNKENIRAQDSCWNSFQKLLAENPSR